MKRYLAIIAAAASFSLLQSPASALESGDTVKIVVPYSPGGGYDTQARLVAPLLEQRLNAGSLDDIKVVVENMSGAGGVIGTSAVYKARPDGTTLLIMDPESSIYQELLTGAPFSVKEFEFLAQQSSDTLVLMTRSDLGLDTFQEALEHSQEKPLLIGASASGGYGYVFPVLLTKMLSDAGVDLQLEYLPLDGTSEIIASMRRGEIEFKIGSHTGFRKAHTEGLVDYLAAFNDPGETVMCADGNGGEVPCPDAAEVLGLAEEDYKALAPAARYRRIYVAPPGTDGEAVELYREALASILTDPEFLKKAAAARQPVTFLPGGKVEEAIAIEVQLAQKYQDYLKSKM